VALPYLAAGYQVFILRYSVRKDAEWPRPLEDYEEAMEMIRSRADEWNLYADKVAVIGFSAGGHLAAAAATMSRNRPNAALLGNAVSGIEVKGCNKSAPDTIPAVDGKTCPCFLFHTRTDTVVPIQNTIDFCSALNKFGVSFECHIYGWGPHGYSVGNSSVGGADALCSRAHNWVADSIAWLKDVFGDFGAGCLTPPKCGGHVNGNYDDTLSITCTMKKLMGIPQAMAIVGPALMELQQKMAARAGGQDMGDMDMSAFMANMTLKDILSFAQTPEAVLQDLDSKLKAIPNT
jgi:predicted esterase